MLGRVVKINTALILCAGFGKRLNPVTLKIPKPLLKINSISMLEKCINLIESIGIQKILINTFYLKDQFSQFLNDKHFNLDIKIIEDGEDILDTGGGVLNAIQYFSNLPFLVINPDTIWSEHYLRELEIMEKLFFENKKNKCKLLIVDKEKSFDKNFKETST